MGINEKNEMFREAVAFIASNTAFPDICIEKNDHTTRLIDFFVDTLEGVCLELGAHSIVSFSISSVHNVAIALSDGTPSTRDFFSTHAAKEALACMGKMERFEDNWLKKYGLSRRSVFDAVAGKTHRMFKFVAMLSDDQTKQRCLNTKYGLYLCSTGTLGWSPVSEVCVTCNFIERCQAITKDRFPELYELRKEYELTIKATDRAVSDTAL